MFSWESHSSNHILSQNMIKCMHRVSLETICPLKAFLPHNGPDNNAKSMVKHFIFLHKFSVISRYLDNEPNAKTPKVTILPMHYQSALNTSQFITIGGIDRSFH